MSRDKQDPIQEQLIQARRDQILKAAVAVFAEKGFQKATIRDVAKMAGIADGTIYNYFENKTALMLAILNGMNDTERREDDLSLALHMDTHEFFQTYIRQRYSRMTEEGLDIMRAILPEVMVNPELRDAIVVECFKRGLLVLGAGTSTIRLSPPLIIDEEQADCAVRLLSESISAATA